MKTTKILLADDHRMLRELLRGMLEKEPDIKIVGETANGREMLRLVRDLSPDIVVLDIAMPELNGIEGMTRLAARRLETKVICLSGYSDRRYVLQMLKAGAAGYVVKAAAGTELLRAIRAVAAGQSYLCPEIANAVLDDIRTSPGSGKTQGGLGSLSSREREVLQLIAEGQRSSSVAANLHISVATVDTHRRNIMRKLRLHTVVELTKFAIREGLIST